MNYRLKYRKYKTKYLALKNGMHHGGDGTKKTHAILNDLYQKIMSILSKSNIKFILFYGTLLGYTRDKNFINGDDDIDVIVSRSDRESLLEYIKKTNITTKIDQDLNQEFIIQLFVDDIGPFDIYIYDIIENKMTIKWTNRVVYPKKILYPIEDIFPCQLISYKNYPIYIPKNPEKVCEYIYGETWKVPAIKHSYVLGKNIIGD